MLEIFPQDVLKRTIKGIYHLANIENVVGDIQICSTPTLYQSELLVNQGGQGCSTETGLTSLNLSIFIAVSHLCYKLLKHKPCYDLQSKRSLHCDLKNFTNKFLPL